MGDLPEERVPYEAIVITENGHINAAALSAVRYSGNIRLRSFKGSNTYENMKKMGVFSVNYIAGEDKELFIRAAAEGWNTDEGEMPEEIEMEPFPHIKKAKGWAVCVPETLRSEKISDEIGETEVLHIEAKILMWEGSALSTIKVGEDRNIMALVAYTRYAIAKGKIRKKYRKKAMELADRGDVVGKWVVEHME